MRTLLSQPLRTQTDRHGETQDGVSRAEIYRGSFRELFQIAESSRNWKTETVVTFIGSGEKCFVEQLGCAVAVNEPTLNACLQRPIAHAVRQEERAMSRCSRLKNDWLYEEGKYYDEYTMQLIRK